MRRRARAGLLSVLFLGLSAGLARFVPDQPAAPAGPTARIPTGRTPVIPGANDVVATIADENANEQVTKGEVINFLSRYPIPANEKREQVYHDAVESLVNTKLLTIFLNRQKIAVPPAKIDEVQAWWSGKPKADGRDLATALLEDNMSLDTIRKELENAFAGPSMLSPRPPKPN